MRVLGIETSCDETALAIYDSSEGLIAHEIFSQQEHKEYGGVVPELASRDHIRKIVPILHGLFTKTGISAENIDGIAYTAGPGLVGALLVGALFGHSLAFAWQCPAIAIHHLEGHLLAPFLEPDPPTFPFLALLVSGGHTQLIKVAAFGDYEIIGESLDDAAGEAFDKTAKLLGLPYPGGPHLAALAKQGSLTRFHFPRPLLEKGLDFSFSGLKTAVATTVAKCNLSDPHVTADIACAFEIAVVETLLTKTLRALTITGLTQLVIAGGVGANQRLRQECLALAKKHGFSVKYPRSSFCTDNGAMIAYAGCQRLLRGERSEHINVRARWPLNDLTSI